jgi:hypothetical protein
LRSAERNGAWNVRKLQTLDEAVPLLTATDDFVLGLPIAAVLAQRFRLPTVDPAEFPEMIRIQIEKALPFSPDEVTTDFEVIEQSEGGSVVSAVAVRNQQLAEMAAPLLERGYIPRQVTVYAAQRASTYAPEGNALLIYPEGETLVSAVTENGKVSLTRTLESVKQEQLQIELPQLRLSAELQGINASFPNVLLDESCYQLRDTVQGILASPTGNCRGRATACSGQTESSARKLATATLPTNKAGGMAEASRLGRRRLRGALPSLACLSRFHARGNWQSRSAYRPRRAPDGICPCGGGQLEGARTGD